MYITAKRAADLVARLEEFKRQTLKEEEDPQFRYWAEGLIDAAILTIERLTK